MRENFEFYCSHCPPDDPKGKRGGYFIVTWDMDRTGQFLFICPHCGREHARTIKKGEMQSCEFEVRFQGGKGKIDIFHDGGGSRPGWERVIILKSAWSRTPRLELVTAVRCGFMNDAWLRLVAAEKGLIERNEERE